jgi:hypothetical protein
MKNHIKLLTLIIIFFSACKKESIKQSDSSSPVPPKITLSKADAMEYIQNQRKENPDPNFILNKRKIDLRKARNVNTLDGNIWKINLKGQPIYQKIKQGYRQIAIKRNKETKAIEARILEVIPDAIYLQKGKNISTGTFTGRVFQYDLDYRLIDGQIYSDGKQIGKIAAKKKPEELPRSVSLKDLNPLKGIQGKTMLLQLSQSCDWYQDYYVDAEGTLTIHSEMICSYTVYDTGGNFYAGGGIPSTGGDSGGQTGGGGGSTPPESPSEPPPPSNLPGENNEKVDPKEMMKCFSAIADPNAAFVIKVYVVEPQPGTSFNVGANSFGHVAISLSKTSGNTTITQTVGFYPTGSGLEKLDSRSQMIDNGDIAYNISSTYNVNNESFQKVVGYISNPPQNYHFTDFNCSAFVYSAGQAGGIPIPDPTTQIGLGGPGGAGFARTPAGLAGALRAQKAANPNLDINEGGGRIPGSKGPCK